MIACRHGSIIATGVLWLLLIVLVWAWPFWFASEAADFWTRQTARVAVLYWFFAVTVLLRQGPTLLARWLWTLACLAYLIHVATAFEQVHHWSHAAAYQHVEETSQFGAGIFVSYALTAGWAIDALVWWMTPAMYQQRRNGLDRAIHSTMAFIVFNGTVVYEEGFIRWTGALLFVLLGGLWLSRQRNG